MLVANDRLLPRSILISGEGIPTWVRTHPFPCIILLVIERSERESKQILGVTIDELVRFKCSFPFTVQRVAVSVAPQRLASPTSHSRLGRKMQSSFQCRLRRPGLPQLSHRQSLSHLGCTSSGTRGSSRGPGCRLEEMLEPSPSLLLLPCTSPSC